MDVFRLPGAPHTPVFTGRTVLTVGDDGGCLVLVENGRRVNERLLFFLLVVFFGTGVSFNHPTDSLFLLT